jgi:hypothetical protein
LPCFISVCWGGEKAGAGGHVMVMEGMG